jgi:hypothetical protein
VAEHDIPLTTEFRLREKAGDEATLKNLPVSVMQALYHEITGRTEVLEKSFYEDFLFHHEEIIQCVYRLLQATEQYNITAADAQFAIKFSSGEKQSFSSLEKFKQIDHARAQFTANCVLTVSFLLTTPGTRTYQNYRISVELSSVAENSSFDPKSRGVLEGGHRATTIKIEYVDFIVAQTLIAIFEVWLGTLDRAKITKEPKLLREIDPDFVSWLGFCSTSLIGFGVFANVFESYPKTNLAFLGFVYASISVAILVAVILDRVSSSIRNKMSRRGRFSFLLITKGDTQIYERVTKQDSKYFEFWQRVFGSIAVGIFSTFVVGLITTYLGLTH